MNRNRKYKVCSYISGGWCVAKGQCLPFMRSISLMLEVIISFIVLWFNQIIQINKGFEFSHFNLQQSIKKTRFFTSKLRLGILLAWLLVGSAKLGFGQTIITQSFTPTTLCLNGDTVTIVFDFSGYNGNNAKTFAAQLSTSTGSFANPVSLAGTVNISGKSQTGNTLKATIPNNLSIGSGYKIRVIDYYNNTIIGTESTSTLTIIRVNSVSLTSLPGTDNQTICYNNAITNIIYSTVRASGIGTPSGLPGGVSATFASNLITISGTPTQYGLFNYSIPLIGGCGTINATGTITVNQPSTITLNSGSQNQTVCSGSAITSTVYTFGGSATNASVTNLPSGLTSSLNTTNKTLTISGIPTTSGTYTITTSGHSFPCTAATISGIITMNSSPSAIISENNGPLCAGDNAVFTLTGTANALVTYKVNSGSDQTVTLAGGVATITINNVNDDQVLTLVSITNGTCSQNLHETSTITVNPLPEIGGFN